METTKNILAEVENLRPEMTDLRRRFHRWPELGGEEERTAQLICTEMAMLGLEPQRVEGTYSLFFTLDTGRSGKTLVLRADIDGLQMPEEEENLAGPKVCVSKREGYCHACGHDAHTAMLLTAARVLCGMKEQLRGRIVFFFESGEENGASYRQVCPALEKLAPDAIWGVHVMASMPTGTVSVQAGPRMSGSGSFRIRIHGKGGHGSRPDQAVNPVVTACEIVSKLQSVVTLQLSPFESGVMTVSSVQGGAAWNIIPDSCYIQGGIRYFEPHVFEKMTAQVKRIVEGICLANGCTAEFDKEPTLMAAVHNDPALAALAQRSVEKVCPGALTEVEPWMASESFGWYQNIVPGVFAFVGMRNEAVGSGALHHNGKFDVDEACMPLGAAATVQFAVDFLTDGE